MEKIVELYNPQNAANLSAEEIGAMEHLTPEELHALAKAYPNTASGNAYLRLKDKNLSDSQQLHAASTFQNLVELHRIGQTNYVIAGFDVNFKRPKAPVEAPTQDLTREQAQGELRNVTTASPQNASFAKDQNDSLVTKEGQGEQGAVTNPLQGGDIAGQSHVLSPEEQEKITSGQNSAGPELNLDAPGNDDFDDDVPLSELTKAGLQEKYEDAFGVKPKDAWTKQQLVDAIEKATPIE